MRKRNGLAGGIFVIGMFVVPLGCGEDRPGDRPGADTTAVTERPAPPEAAAGAGPELVGRDVISLPDRNETFPAEDPLTGDLWYSVYDGSFDDQTIMVARADAGTWAPPAVAPFSGTWGDRAPRFSPDGSTLFFTSNRPRPGFSESADMNIWRMTRSGSVWGQPELVSGPVNSPEADMHASATNAAIWVASNREGTRGRSDIFRVAADGSVEHLPVQINDERSQPDILVAPEEDWMILAITDHPDGLGGDDLFLARFAGGAWTAPVHLGAPINSPDYEYGPTLSADGTRLYFTSHRGDDANVYSVRLADVLGAVP